MSGYPSYLIHYGIQGQKWGVRRFQNEDGTWTSDGLERRRKLEESGASKMEIWKAGHEGKRELKYNKMLAKSQNTSNKRFDEVTKKIESNRKAGLNVSEKHVKKAIKFGTDVRTADYIAKDPKNYYDNMKIVERNSAINGFVFGLAGLPISMIEAGIVAAINNREYKDSIEKAKKETIADLKKRKLI